MPTSQNQTSFDHRALGAGNRLKSPIREDMHPGAQTPWGRAETVTYLSDGISFVSAPGGDGYWLAAPVLDRIPAQQRRLRARGTADPACPFFAADGPDWAMVPVAFPHVFDFDRRTVTRARAVFDAEFQPRLDAGEGVDPTHTHFYVTAIGAGGEKYLVAGPYGAHGDAIAALSPVRALAEDSDPKAFWMRWGTAGGVERHKTPLGPYRPDIMNGRDAS